MIAELRPLGSLTDRWTVWINRIVFGMHLKIAGINATGEIIFQADKLFNL